MLPQPRSHRGFFFQAVGIHRRDNSHIEQYPILVSKTLDNLAISLYTVSINSDTVKNGVKMTNIANIKVWNDTRGGRVNEKTEWRLYVRTVDEREGCYYITGNRWHPKASTDGNLTDAEWKEVQELSFYDRKWHTVYESELHGTIFGKPVNSPNWENRDGYQEQPTPISDREDYRDSDMHYEG